MHYKSIVCTSHLETTVCLHVVQLNWKLGLESNKSYTVHIYFYIYIYSLSGPYSPFPCDYNRITIGFDRGAAGGYATREKRRQGRRPIDLELVDYGLRDSSLYDGHQMDVELVNRRQELVG
jgi:hypothetical protein